jgi:hypothetical protein
MTERRKLDRVQEIHRVRVYGNFRTPAWDRDRKPAWKTRQERRAQVVINAEKHLANVRKLPCCLCGASPHEYVIDAHHLRGRDWDRGLGRKPPDCRVVPLCRLSCHDEVQRVPGRKETAWIQREGGFNCEHLADSLYNKHLVGGSPEDYQRVLLSFMLSASAVALREKRKRVPAAGRRPRAYRVEVSS